MPTPLLMFSHPRRPPAEQLAVEMRAAPGQALRVSARELCARFAITRLTTLNRLQIARLLAANGVAVDPPLALDDTGSTPAGVLTLRPRQREAVTDHPVPYGPPRPVARTLVVHADARADSRRWRMRLPHRAVRGRAQ